MRFPPLYKVALYLFFIGFVTASPNIQEQLLITSPPVPQATHCPHSDLFRRQESCQYGQCGTSCLAQGAFCCGPAGTVATSPFWVCDNGACITSVRGTTGVVDCYDPENPSGTTQSCIDEKATSTCNPTDRCFTCTSEQPYCQWETYIASNSPTLRWFSCVGTRNTGITFYADTITANPPTSKPQSAASSAQPASSSATSSAPAGGATKDKKSLSTGAIIGIGVGGGIALVIMGGLFVYCCLTRRRPRPPPLPPPPQELPSSPAAPLPPMDQRDPLELDSREYGELNSSTAYSPHSHPSTPFTPPARYGTSVEEIDMWRRGTLTTAADRQAKEAYYASIQSPRELHEGRRED